MNANKQDTLVGTVSDEPRDREANRRKGREANRRQGRDESVVDAGGQAELVRLHIHQLPVAMTSHLIGPPLLLAVVWDSVPHGWLVAWAATLMAFGALRGLHWFTRWRSAELDDEAALNARARLVILTGLAGALWGAGGALSIVTSGSLHDQAFAGFVLAILAAGAVGGLSCYLPAFYGAVVPMLLAGGGAFLASGGQPHTTMGVALLVFLPAAIYFGHTVHGAIRRSVTLRLEKAALLERLSTGHAAAEALAAERTRELRRANAELEDRIIEQAAAERALEGSERQLRLITDNLPVMIGFVGRDFRIRFVNRAYETSYGRDRESLIGIPVKDMIGEEAFERALPYAKRVLAGETVSFADDRAFPAGKRHIRVTLIPHRATDGPVDAYFGLVEDRTEEWANELARAESEQRLRRVIQNMPVMMSAMDEVGNIIVWNRECERITGYSAEEIVGNQGGFALLYPDPAYRAQVKEALFVHSDYRDWEWDLTCRDGTVKTVSWFNISSRHPVPGWASWEMGFDVSDRNRARVELEMALRKEKELGELKSRFVAMASHEFRTPLTTIQAAVDLLMRYGDRLGEEQKRENLVEIRREVGNINELLNGVLTIGKTEAGQLAFRPKPTDVRTLCADLLEKSKLDAQPEHVFVFDCVGGCASVEVDDQLIRHILTNMLSNAVKYSPRGGRITLSLRCGSESLVIAVSDQGIGMPADGRERIFEAFHRFENVGAISGTGLGLAILKRAVDRHGGAVEFESEEGRGTTFRVTLPVGSSKTPDQDGAPETPAAP